MFRTDCKKLYNLIRQRNTNVKNILTKTRNREVSERNVLKTYNITKNPAGSKRSANKIRAWNLKNK
jgi:hypothetical protein